MPTILDILNFDKPYYSFGKSKLSNSKEPIMFFNDPNFQLINDSMMYVFSNYKLKEAYHYKLDSHLTKPLQGKFAKEEIEATNYFKALIQHYNNDVLENKTYYK